MCIVSDKIKFCTCVDGEVNLIQLNNYWILYRFNSKSAIEVRPLVVGKFIETSDPIFEINQETILKRIHEADAFDFPIKFKNKDTLVIHLNNNSDNDSEKISYQFRYERRKWEAEPFDDNNDAPEELVSINNKNGTFLTQKLEIFKTGNFEHSCEDMGKIKVYLLNEFKIFDITKYQQDKIEGLMYLSPSINIDDYSPNLILQYWENNYKKVNYQNLEEQNSSNDDGISYKYLDELSGEGNLNINATYIIIYTNGEIEQIYNYDIPQRPSIKEFIDILKLKSSCQSLSYYKFEILK